MALQHQDKSEVAAASRHRYGGFAAAFGVTASLLSIYSQFASLPIDTSSDEWHTYKMVPVIGKTFRNEKVVLDGKSFIDCTFENVTFEYNGTAPANMAKNRISSSRIFASSNKAIERTLILLRDGVHFIPNEIQVYPKNE